MQIATVFNHVNRNIVVHQQQFCRQAQTLGNQLSVTVAGKKVALPFWNSRSLTFSRISTDFVLVDEERACGHVFSAIDLRARNGSQVLCGFDGESPEDIARTAERIETLRKNVSGWMVHSYTPKPFALIEEGGSCHFFNGEDVLPVELQMTPGRTPHSPVDIAFESGENSFSVTAFQRPNKYSHWSINGVLDSLANELKV